MIEEEIIMKYLYSLQLDGVDNTNTHSTISQYQYFWYTQRNLTEILPNYSLRFEASRYDMMT